MFRFAGPNESWYRTLDAAQAAWVRYREQKASEPSLADITARLDRIENLLLKGEQQ